MSVKASISLVVALLLPAGSAFAQNGECRFLARSEGRFGNGALVEGNLGANDPGGFLRLGRKTQVAEGVTVAGDSVAIGNGSQVPVVAANTLHAPKADVGSVSGAMLPLEEPFCPIPPLECGGPSVRASRGETVGPLMPGSYDEVELANGSTLTLAAGTYSFCSFRTGRNVTVELLGPGASTLDVVGDLRLGNGSTLAPSATGLTPTLRVGGAEAKFGAHVVVEGFLSAPEADLRVGRASSVTGAFCADRVVTGRNVVLQCAEAPPTTTTTTTSSTTTTVEPTTTTSSSTTTTTEGPTTTTSASTTSSTTTTTPTTTTTTSTAAPTTTTTSSTTTTTSPTGVMCSAMGINVTSILEYDQILVGDVAGIVMNTDYPAPLAIPGTGVLSPSSEGGMRFTSLLPPPPPSLVRRDEDTDTNGVDDQARLEIVRLEGTVAPGQTHSIRFDCPAGTVVMPSSLSCVTSGAVNAAGIPFPPVIADMITCRLELSTP
jgi:hypothetical protein